LLLLLCHQALEVRSSGLIQHLHPDCGPAAAALVLLGWC
jgi:hypothetical protein